MASVKALMAMLLMFLLIMMAPVLLTATGSCLALMGKLMGVLYKGAPLIYIPLAVIFSFLWGLRSYLTSKS